MAPISPVDGASKAFLSQGRQRKGPPLGFVARKGMIGPRVIGPITGVPQILYAPFS